MTQQPLYGSPNPHPLKMRTELVWEGKYDQYGNRREVDITECAMPVQKIESIDWQLGKPCTHDWQDYRIRKERSLKTISKATYEYPAPGKYIACVKVVDAFGCDTSITVEVEV